jgi:hypothetical protein
MTYQRYRVTCPLFKFETVVEVGPHEVVEAYASACGKYGFVRYECCTITPLEETSAVPSIVKLANAMRRT